MTSRKVFIMENITTKDLVLLLTQAMNSNNQMLVNHYAVELAARLYVPNKEYSYDDILYGFGYRELENQNKQISIDEYMRSRGND